MSMRRLLGCLAGAALAVGAGSGCKGERDGAKPRTSAAELELQCQQLATVCGDKDKHVEAILGACKEAVPADVESGCAAQVLAVYACYEKELCGKADKVWALDDLRVLAERQTKCVAERDAARACEQK